jgi:hypothetical protein
LRARNRNWGKHVLAAVDILSGKTSKTSELRETQKQATSENPVNNNNNNNNNNKISPEVSRCKQGISPLDINQVCKEKVFHGSSVVYGDAIPAVLRSTHH